MKFILIDSDREALDQASKRAGLPAVVASYVEGDRFPYCLDAVVIRVVGRLPGHAISEMLRILKGEVAA